MIELEKEGSYINFELSDQSPDFKVVGMHHYRDDAIMFLPFQMK